MLNISVFGGSDLGKRPWNPGKKLWTITGLGGMEIDFQRAQLVEGTTKVVCIALFGGIALTVPAELPVTVSGVSLFGGREVELSGASASPSSGGKSLAIAAFALFGGVTVREPKR